MFVFVLSNEGTSRNLRELNNAVNLTDQSGTIRVVIEASIQVLREMLFPRKGTETNFSGSTGPGCFVGRPAMALENDLGMIGRIILKQFFKQLFIHRQK
jgi:hypothetical protein